MTQIPKPLIDEIIRWINEGKYGNLQINFSAGKVVNVNRTESIKVDQLSPNPVVAKIDFIAITSCKVDN